MKRVRNKKEGKFSIPAFIIPVLDYVYYRIWLWCQNLLLATLPLYIRYDYSNKYKNSNYQLFRDRWENEPIEKHKRNGKIILATFIIIVIIIPITLIFLSIIGIIPELPIW